MIGSKEIKQIEKLLEKYGGSGWYITDYIDSAYEIPYSSSIKLPTMEVETSDNRKCKHNGGYFMKLYQKCDNLIMDCCTPGEYMFLAKIKRFVSFNENVLRKGGSSVGHLLNAKEIASELGMSVTTVRDYIRFLKATDIIKEYYMPSKDNPKQKNKCICINPWIYSKGKAMLVDVYQMFEKTFWCYVANGTDEEIESIERYNPILVYKANQIKGYTEK